MNLNDSVIRTDDSAGWKALADNSITSPDGISTVYFRNLDKHLIKHIERARMIVGCVAWLTSFPILNTLARVPNGVSIIVQKEDFLRPDVGFQDDWKSSLRQAYERLKPVPERYTLGGLAGSLSVASNPKINPIRCCGNHNRDKGQTAPRMHNKFLVFCDLAEVEPNLKPFAVWTGSFNFSKSATMSFENALVLTDEVIVKAYFREWEQVLAMSEPLDWRSEWCEPEWRVGT